MTISLQIWITHSFFYFTMVLKKKFINFFWVHLELWPVIQWSKRINGSKLNSRKNKYHFYKVKFIGQSHKYMKRNDTFMLMPCRVPQMTAQRGPLKCLCRAMPAHTVLCLLVNVLCRPNPVYTSTFFKMDEVSLRVLGGCILVGCGQLKMFHLHYTSCHQK